MVLSTHIGNDTSVANNKINLHTIFFFAQAFLFNQEFCLLRPLSLMVESESEDCFMGVI